MREKSFLFKEKIQVLENIGSVLGIALICRNKINLLFITPNINVSKSAVKPKVFPDANSGNTFFFSAN